MNEQPDLPEGAIPTEDDHLGSDHQEHPELPETMIGGEPSVTIDAEEVEDVVASFEDALGEGEPLPVGANDPAVLAEAPADPPGMPHQPDDLDREMARRAHEDYIAAGEPRGEMVRWDQATLPDARADRRVHTDLRVRTVREALLRHVAEQAERERGALRDYARAVRATQEARDVYAHACETRAGAEQALFVLGLDVAADHATVEPSEPDPIPDHQIV